MSRKRTCTRIATSDSTPTLRFTRSGVHLFDRSTGLNVLLDEVVPPETAWSRAPRHVSIALLNACDLTCAHCYAPKMAARLPPESILTWAQELDAEGCLGVGFGGGEPTLYPGLASLCERIAKRTRLAITITTHAHHLTEDLLGHLSEHVNFIRVSMDGVAATYESIRGRSFAQLQRRLDEIREVVPFGINYLVNDETVSQLPTAARIAAESGASEFALLPEQPTASRRGISPGASAQMRAWTSSYSGPMALAASELGSEGLRTCSPLACDDALDRYAHVTATGHVSASSFEQPAVEIGERGILDALDSLRALQHGDKA